MSGLSFKDRFLTPPVARAILSPSAIVLAGAGAAAVIATGLPLVVAPVAAVAAWGARVLAAVPRGKVPSARIDPFTVPEPWRSFVVQALVAQRRFADAVRGAERGPITDRLGTIGERVDDAVDECWRIARRGAQLVEARRHIDDDDAERDLKRIGAAASADPGSSLAATVRSLQAQIDTARRLDRVVADAHDRLLLLDARLDEAVARAIELSVQASDASDLTGLDADVEGLVSEMESLRQALEETGRTSTSGGGPAGGTA